MIKFRPDIAGLRGVAVMLVLLAHASVPGFSGGFIGVDVFFVISGFLITGLLLEEKERTGRIDFANFYARRIKRLAGALLAMLVLVSTVSLLVVPLGMQPDLSNAAFWASVWASNMHLAFTGTGYFDALAKDNVFLHTWSLGVEEQFYLIWPLFVLWVCRGSKGSRITVLITVVTLLSFAACISMAQSDATLAYYFTPTRLWQLSIGGLAWVLRDRFHYLSLVGLILLGSSIVFISGATPYPSWWAVLPTLGSAAVLSAMSPEAISTRLLSVKPLQWLGQISYSLYLWHWPVLVLGTLMLPSSHWVLRIGMLLFAIAVAVASERWIERPLRASRESPRRTIRLGLMATTLVAAGLWLWCSQATEAAADAQSNSPENLVEQVVRRSISLPEVYRTSGFDEYYDSDRIVPIVVFKPPAGNPSRRVVLAGDSVLMQWEPAFRMIARKHRWELVAVTKSACPMVDIPFVNQRIKRRYVECEQWRNRLREFLNSYKPDTTITGSAATYEFTSSQWLEGSRSILAWMTAASGEVIVIIPPPTLPFDGVTCVRQRGVISDGRVTAPNCVSPLDRSERLNLRKTWEAILMGMTKARSLVMDDAVCPQENCSAISGEFLVFRDNQHLTAPFVESLSSELERQLGSSPSPER